MPKSDIVESSSLRISELLNCPEPLGKIVLPSDTHFPGVCDVDAYALQLAGNCLEPVAGDGAYAIISPSRPCDPGDFVALFFADGRVPQIKRLLVPSLLPLGKPMEVSNVAGLIMVEMLSPRQIIRLRACDLTAMHKVLGFFKRGGSISLAGRIVQ